MIDNDPNVNFVVAAALRYSLGRSSYIVPIIQDFIRQHLNNKFIKQDIALYIQDIERYFSENIQIDKYTQDSWAVLLDQLKVAQKNNIS